jgi:glucose/arabinose dehydrogenase
LRKDLTVRKVAALGSGFVRLAYDARAGQLIYMNPSGDLYHIKPTDKTATTGNRLHTSYEAMGQRCNATGLAIGPDSAIYATCNSKWAGTNTARVRKGVLNSNGKRTWQTLMQTDPYPIGDTQFDHDFNGLAISPDGKWLYVNSGSRTDHGEVEDAKGQWPNLRETLLTATVFRIPASSKTTIVLPNDATRLKPYIFAQGVRNCYDMAFAANGDLFCGENSADADYPDEINWLRAGRHYGFPWRMGNEDNAVTKPGYTPSADKKLHEDFFAVANDLYQFEPNFPAPPSGITFTDPITNLGPDADSYRRPDGGEGDASREGVPLLGITPHRSPLGLVFDATNALNADYKGALFVLSWGSAGGTLRDIGQDLLLVKPTKRGEAYAATMTQIARGFSNPIDAVLVGKKLYVLDFGDDGVLWEIEFP